MSDSMIHIDACTEALRRNRSVYFRGLVINDGNEAQGLSLFLVEQQRVE